MWRNFWFVVLLPCCAVANDDFFSSVDIDIDDKLEEPASGFSYRGYWQLTAKYGLEEPEEGFSFNRDARGLSRVRSDGFIELRGDASRNVYWQLSAKAELDWLQWQNGESEWRLHREALRLKDAYIDASFDNGAWLRAGNQVLAWGDSEGLAITDVLSPVDSREPGQAELQDLREQIPAIMLAVPALGGTLSTVVTYMAGSNRYAESDEEFYPLVAFTSSDMTFSNLDTEKEWELAMRWERQLNGGDISVMAGEINDNAFAVNSVSIEGNSAVIALRQERVRVMGGTLNRVLGDWLLRGELAHYWDQPVELGGALPWVQMNQWRTMLGVEYSGITDLTLSYEASTVFAPEVISVEAENSWQTPQWQLGHVFRLRHTALNERLNNQLWLMALTTDETQLARWDMSYELSDNWTMAIAAIVYQNRNPNSIMYAFRNNDTLNASVKFSF